MQKLGNIALAALRMLRSALPRGAEVKAVDLRPDSLVRISVPQTPPLLLQLDGPEPRGRPGDAQAPLHVAVFRSLPHRERERLRREGTSFIDLSGAVFLQAPGFYLDRSDLPSAHDPVRGKKGADPYADRGSLVLRALLAAPRAQRWSTQRLARDADVDTATASRVVRELRRRELVRDETPGQGRRSSIWIPDARKLIEDWARTYSWEDNLQLRTAAPVGTPRHFIRRLGKLLGTVRWALTLHAGASELAPHAAFETIHAYIDPDVDLAELAFEQGWEVSPSGRLCLMHPAYAESVWFQARSVQGALVVSPLQLVLDLWHYPVRGREQAQHLIETVLEPIWDADAEPD
jgi:hypothetical protein